MNLKDSIITLSQNERFVHHKRYANYHLLIVEKISQELCDIFKEADKDIVNAMVWMHDYPKIICSQEHNQITLENEGRQFLLEHGYTEDITKTIIDYINIMDQKNGLHQEHIPIEIKIISSADGLSHMIGPFHLIWLYENPQKDLNDLLYSSIKKINTDREKKIVIQEIKDKYLMQYKYLLSLHGSFKDQDFIK